MRKNRYRQKGRPIKNEKGWEFGQIIGDRFVKHVSAERHLLWFPRGWSFDIAVLEQAEQAGVTEVVVIDDDSGRKYTASLESLWTNGEYVNRGYGEQKCLPLEYWTKTDI